MRRLVVVDSFTRLNWWSIADSRLDGTWEFLLLGLKREDFEAEYRQQLPAISWTYAQIDSLSEQCHQIVLDFVVRLIPALGRIPWAQALHEAWWYLEIVEKSAARGDWIEQLYRLTLICRLATRYNETWLQLRPSVLAQALQTGSQFRWIALVRPHRVWTTPRVVGSAIKTALANALHWALTRSHRGRLHDLDAKVTIFTHYPDFWVGDRERFFPTFSGPWLVWLNRPAWMMRNHHRLKHGGLYPLQAALRLGDLLGLLSSRWLVSALRLDLSPPPLDFRLEGLDVSALIHSELARSLASRDFFQCQLIRRGLARMLTTTRPEALIFRMEFQGFENALLQASRGQVLTCGYRHSVLSRWLASHRFAPGELPDARPMPEVVWTPSARVRELMAAEGFPTHRLVLCGPQRQADAPRRHPPVSGCRLLVALGMRAAENEILLESLERALQDLPQVEVLIRPHPAAPGVPERFKHLPTSTGPITDSLRDSAALITPGSTMAFEAMAAGTMPIIFEEPTNYCYYSLAEYVDALFVANTAEQLRQAILASVTNAPECQQRRERWEAAVAGAFGDLQTPLDVQRQRAIRESQQVWNERRRDSSTKTL